MVQFLKYPLNTIEALLDSNRFQDFFYVFHKIHPGIYKSDEGGHTGSHSTERITNPYPGKLDLK